MNRGWKRDDAVANVVIMLLILATIVMAFSVIFGLYLPSLKETAEIQHSEDVKSAFMRFSSDVDTVYSRGLAGTSAEVFSLGGGDVLFSSSKSSGTVIAETGPINESAIDTITITYLNKTPIYLNNSRGSTIHGQNQDILRLFAPKLSYSPVLPYWQNQGYLYENGMVWIQKNDVFVPVASHLHSVDEGKKEEQDWTNRILMSVNPVFVEKNMMEKEGETDITYIYSLQIVNFSVDAHRGYASGSDEVKLQIIPVWHAETEYELAADNPVVIGGRSISFAVGTKPTLLRLTEIEAKVSIQ